MADKIGLEDVKSSTLAAFGYDGFKQIIAIKFKTGRIWHYAGAAPDLMADFIRADSKGQFYNAYIKGKLSGEEMTGVCPKCGDIGWIGDKCEDCGCADYVARERPILHRHSDAAPNGRQFRADCGAWGRKSDFARSAEGVTCPDCKRLMAEYADGTDYPF